MFIFHLCKFICAPDAAQILFCPWNILQGTQKCSDFWWYCCPCIMMWIKNVSQMSYIQRWSLFGRRSARSAWAKAKQNKEVLCVVPALSSASCVRWCVPVTGKWYTEVKSLLWLNLDVCFGDLLNWFVGRVWKRLELWAGWWVILSKFQKTRMEQGLHWHLVWVGHAGYTFAEHLFIFCSYSEIFFQESEVKGNRLIRWRKF